MAQPQRGFTLIELLIVISIIALMSSVVLASVNDARTKAANAERLQQVDEYRKALELARDSDGKYPQTNAYRCLGNPPSGICFYNRLVVPAIVNALTPYMPSFPLAPAAKATPQYDGLQYFTCPGPSVCGVSSLGVGPDLPMDTYGIQWVMDGSNASCGPGTAYVYNPPLPPFTFCTYVHQ